MQTPSTQFTCGVVEGFYGRPWNARQRHKLFTWMQSWGLNTYLYGPKDDLKHRAFWRELYDECEAAELAALIRDCQRHGLHFIYALAPGLDLDYTSEGETAAWQKKVEQLLELGCQQFALLFDDIEPAILIPGLSRVQSLGMSQSSVANAFLKFIRSKTANGSLIFCPTEYCGSKAKPCVKDSAYLKELGQLLDPAIQVLWTGPEIISETIGVESIRELQSVLQRKPLIWDNLHANDYDMRRAYVGPYSGRTPELRQEVSGILSNPNCEFEANFVPLRTLAMFVRSGDNWDPRQAYLTTLRKWLPEWALHRGAVSSGQTESTSDEPLALKETIQSAFQDLRAVTLDELELLGDCFYLPFEVGRRAEDFLSEIQFLLRTPQANWDASLQRLFTCGHGLTSLFSKISALENRDLLYAFYRHLWELNEEIKLLFNYLNWLLSKPGPGEMFTSSEYRPKVYRGGLVTALQRLLPMNDAGGFSHRPSLIPSGELHGFR